MKTKLALDPGGTTGVAIRLADGRVMTTAVTQASELWDFFAEANRPEQVIFEVFNTAGRVDKHMIHTMELVGGIKALCYALRIPGYAYSPQHRYAFKTDAEKILKSLKRRYVVHELDALSHLLAHEHKHGQ